MKKLLLAAFIAVAPVAVSASVDETAAPAAATPAAAAAAPEVAKADTQASPAADKAVEVEAEAPKAAATRDDFKELLIEAPAAEKVTPVATTPAAAAPSAVAPVAAAPAAKVEAPAASRFESVKKFFGNNVASVKGLVESHPWISMSTAAVVSVVATYAAVTYFAADEAEEVQF